MRDEGERWERREGRGGEGRWDERGRKDEGKGRGTEARCWSGAVRPE